MKVIRLPRSSAHRLVRARDGKGSEELQALARRLQEPAEVSPDGEVVVDARTRLPTEFGEFDVRLFRFRGEPAEHLVLSVGDLAAAGPVPVRLHSACFTGEVLQSHRCECADQLAHAMAAVQRLGRGVIVYLRQEGRGIGLANKLRAYALQAAGADTVDANRLLGLPDDARTYDAAAAVLRHLGISEVTLLTNNPLKAEALEQLGVRVAGRIPVVVPTNPLAQAYLETKRDRMRHEVPAQLELTGRARR